MESRLDLPPHSTHESPCYVEMLLITPLSPQVFLSIDHPIECSCLHYCAPDMTAVHLLSHPSITVLHHHPCQEHQQCAVQAITGIWGAGWSKVRHQSMIPHRKTKTIYCLLPEKSGMFRMPHMMKMASYLYGGIMLLEPLCKCMWPRLTISAHHLAALSSMSSMSMMDATNGGNHRQRDD